jgi:hypothetical protein
MAVVRRLGSATWLEQRCGEEPDTLVVHKEVEVKGDLASTLGDSQRIRRLRGGARGCVGIPGRRQSVSYPGSKERNRSL